MATPDPSQALAASTTWTLIADFRDNSDEGPKEYSVVNFVASAGVAEVLVDPLHPGARVAELPTTTVPGTGVEGVVVNNNGIPQSFLMVCGRIRRVFARSIAGATIGHGATAQ